MCGIVAIVRLSERPLPGPEVVRAMAARLAHRGPDGDGFFQDDDCALGVVRLAVLDPQGGRQPARGCSPVVSVANSELYNHPELRGALAGHPLADRCDTTLLPHLYEAHGDELVARLRGMFAFALWDATKRRLLLARDRLGIKPLFYTVTRDYLLAASEAKALFASGLVPARVDPRALDDLFSLGYPCPPRTMFRGVVELPPGHTLSVEARGAVAAPKRYWRAPIPPRGQHRAGSLDTQAGELREVLDEAVQRHARADVPVASSLSGGLDSSLVSALAARGGVTDTYSLGFPHAPRLDESRHVEAVNRALGTRGHPVPLEAADASLLPQMVEKLELPLLMPGALGGLKLSQRERADGVKVALTGDGADELLGGYDVFRAEKARRLLPGPLFALGVGLVARPRGIARFLTGARPAGWGVAPPWFPQWKLLDLEREALLSVDGRRVRPVEEPPEGWARLVRDDAAALDPLDAQLGLELETRLPAWILVISDRSHMAHGVEARVPFLDDEVVKHVLSLPPAFKLRGLREKAVLREAARGLLPAAIRARRKQPFTTPVFEWFFQRPPDFVADALSPAALRDAGLFDPATVERLLRALPATPAGHVERLRHELVLMLVLGTQLLARGLARTGGAQ